MKNILIALALTAAIPSLAVTKKKEKPKPAFETGSFTAVAAYGYPGYIGSNYSPLKAFGPIIGAVYYQVSRGYNIGLQYGYEYSRYPIREVKMNGVSYAPLQYQTTLHVHAFSLINQYCFLNRGRISLSTGIGLSFRIDDRTLVFNDNQDHPEFQWLGPDQRWVGYDLRLLDARVRITDNFGVYGTLHGKNSFSAGLHYTFLSKKIWAGKQKKDAERSFDKGKMTVKLGISPPGIANMLTFWSYPTFEAGIHYQLSRRINLSLQYSICTGTSRDIATHDTSGHVQYYGKYKTSVNMLVAACDFYWFNRGRIACYSGLGIGVVDLQASATYSDGINHLRQHFNDEGWRPAPRITLAGVKADLAKGLGVYAEVGIINNSVAACGLHYTFGGKNKY